MFVLSLNSGFGGGEGVLGQGKLGALQPVGERGYMSIPSLGALKHLG